MPTTAPPGTEQNRLLASLLEADYDRLALDLEAVELAARQVLVAPAEAIRHVYFPRDAVVALLVPMEDGMTVEGATIGNEGLVGLEVYFGDGTATEQIVCQIPGSAARIERAPFLAAVERSASLRALLQRYTLVLMNQLARTAGCNRVHSVEERCARWLLMSHDRARRDTFPLTHERLAILLGVRRASVSLAAELLQQSGIIAYHHGWITIRDHGRLEAVSCEDYRLSREGYDRLYEHRWN